MQKDIPEPIPELIDRYLAGDATPAEQVAVREWLDVNPNEDRILSAIGDRAKGPHQQLDFDLDLRTASVVAYSARRRAGAINMHGVAATSGAGSYKTRAFPFSIRRSGAIFVLVAVCFILVSGNGFLKRIFAPEQATAMSIYSTRNGERATLMLPDSSVVELNVASELRVPTGFNSSNREVHLTGEAMFTIRHASKSPFVVVAGKATTKVLGTQFIVRNYPSDVSARVAVLDGKVSVDSRILTAMQQVVLDGNQSRVRSIEDFTDLDFTIGRLFLTDISLSSALPQLNRWYDADIYIQDAELNTLSVTAAFKQGTINDLIGILEMTFPIRVERNGKTLLLYRR